MMHVLAKLDGWRFRQAPLLFFLEQLLHEAEPGRSNWLRGPDFNERVFHRRILRLHQESNHERRRQRNSMGAVHKDLS